MPQVNCTADLGAGPDLSGVNDDAMVIIEHAPRVGPARSFLVTAEGLAMTFLKGFGLTAEQVVAHEVRLRRDSSVKGRDAYVDWDSAVWEGDKILAVIIGRGRDLPPVVRWIEAGDDGRAGRQARGRKPVIEVGGGDE